MQFKFVLVDSTISLFSSKSKYYMFNPLNYPQVVKLCEYEKKITTIFAKVKKLL